MRGGGFADPKLITAVLHSAHTMHSCVFVWTLKLRLIALYSINCSVFVRRLCVYCAVRTESMYKQDTLVYIRVLVSQ